LYPAYIPSVQKLLEQCFRLLTDVPITAFFETSFFDQLPEAVKWYALPREYSAKNKVQKWGFHGYNHEANAKLFPAKSK